VRDFIAAGGVLPERPGLVTDLTGLRKKQSAVNAKIEVVYQENLPSPDEAAALALTLAEHVSAPPSQVVTREVAAALGFVEPGRAGISVIERARQMREEGKDSRPMFGIGRAR
jgi:hypothetical protein